MESILGRETDDALATFWTQAAAAAPPAATPYLASRPSGFFPSTDCGKGGRGRRPSRRGLPGESLESRHAFDPPDLRPRAEDELYLTTRRGKQLNSIVQKDVDQLTGAARDHVLMSRADMDRLGLHGDADIELTSGHGAMRGRVLEAKITPGNVQVHWPEANVLLDPERIDPGGKVPDYGARVRVRAL